MLKTLEEEFGFKIKTIQTNNGREFCNDRGQKESVFEKVVNQMKYPPYALLMYVQLLTDTINSMLQRK